MSSNSKVKFYWEGLPFKGIIYASFGISIFLILAVLILRSFLPPQVPLLYGEPVGESQLVNSIFLAVTPAFSLIATLINTFIASRSKDDFIQKVLIITSMLITFLIFITYARIVFLVGTF